MVSKASHDEAHRFLVNERKPWSRESSAKPVSLQDAVDNRTDREGPGRGLRRVFPVVCL